MKFLNLIILVIVLTMSIHSCTIYVEPNPLQPIYLKDYGDNDEITFVWIMIPKWQPDDGISYTLVCYDNLKTPHFGETSEIVPAYTFPGWPDQIPGTVLAAFFKDGIISEYVNNNKCDIEVMCDYGSKVIFKRYQAGGDEYLPIGKLSWELMPDPADCTVF